MARQGLVELLCLKGENFSMVSDQQFEEEENPDGYFPFIRKQISKEIFVSWLFNAKAITKTETTIGTALAGTPPSLEETTTVTTRSGIMVKDRPFTSDNEIADDVPFPLRILDGETFRNKDDILYLVLNQPKRALRPSRTYFYEEEDVSGYITHGVWFYIHKDNFYATWDSGGIWGTIAFQEATFDITETTIDTLIITKPNPEGAFNQYISNTSITDTFW
jgi:hypothetical protein